MSKVFNTTGLCVPQMHYMVNIDSKLADIKSLVDRGAYFTINRAGNMESLPRLMH